MAETLILLVTSGDNIYFPGCRNGCCKSCVTLPMMLQREQRAELVQSILTRKKLTRHAAHLRLEMSRPSLEKLWNGLSVDMQTIEQFARKLDLDVNEWRNYWGYEPIESGSQILKAGLYELSQRAGEVIPLERFDNPEQFTPEEARAELADIEEELRKRGLLKD